MANIHWEIGGSLVEQWRAQIEQVINDTSAYINSFLARAITFDVSVTISSLNGAIATGGADFINTGAESWEFVGAYQSRTGTEVAGYDAIITFDPDYLRESHFSNSPVPSYMIDGFSVLIHEMLHGIGFNGRTDWATFENNSQAYSPFDRHIQIEGGKPYFNGANVNRLMGGPVLLEAGNIFHLSHDEHERDLMNPYALNGERYQMSELDLAILADLGLGTIRNDILVSSDTSDNIAGGAGFDIVLFEGRRNDYLVEVQGNGSAVIKSGSVTDYVSSVERLKFSDGVLALDFNDHAGQAYRLYQAAFERTPDMEGLRYWIDRLDSGTTSLNAIADSFIHSPEFINTYGTVETVSNATFVELLYLHTLGRDYDQQGFQYWVDRLDGNQTNRGDLLAFFSESDENRARVADAVDDGIWLV